jgi:glucose-1-phosphate thymidylyltransferase
VFEDSLAPHTTAFAADPGGARVLLKRVPDAQRFGVATLDAGGQRVVRIAEKPPHPESDLAVTGVYLYDEHVFDIIRTLTPSARGELEITDVNNAYLERDQLGFGEFVGWWSDAGTPESYAHANQLAAAIEPPPELRG